MQVRRLVAWLACVAVLLASLVPTLSQALASNGSAAWAEICTAHGSKVVAVGQTNRSGPELPTEHLLQHCPYCSLHLTTLGMPAALMSVPALSAHPLYVSASIAVAPRTLSAWANCQARAPPHQT